ncbi:hypothetical protein B0F90DRAFT_1876045 [Multifurca ochricompacta]|uniref:Histone-lysine N-methyltransferase SET5 n=1 Tax=Multifurca ochricompacta TaxID=376703 RepID=A0AAD4QLS0_9AGAM|nr:hypothetical protein B0F90DRAFT_1876045 [Multifurca ochricompacta]
MSTSLISPPEEYLKSAVVSLKKDHPSLGIAKFHTLLLSENPTWTVSEKRLRRILNAKASYYSHRSNNNNNNTKKPLLQLDLRALPISEGQIVWKEDPFIIAPEWDIYDLQVASRACGYCTTPLTDSSLVMSCPASSSSALCPVRFCHRLCLKRSENTHPLVCPAQNPGSIPLLAFARKHSWMAIHALTQCTARLLLAAQQANEDTLRDDWSVYRALAELGMEERAQGSWLQGAEPDRATWQAAHKAFVQAFKLAKLLKRPPPKDVADALFTYDGFLHGLGRMSLNLEAHGGLYTLHSHLNHSCRPNISVRHFDQRTTLSRITIVAKRNITAGEELLVTYVDPSLGVHERRSQLGAGEEKEKEKEVKTNNDLERELKAGLGVM